MAWMYFLYYWPYTARSCQFYPYRRPLTQLHCSIYTKVPMPMKQPWRIWVYKPHKSSRMYESNQTKHNKSMCVFYGLYYITGGIHRPKIVLGHLWLSLLRLLLWWFSSEALSISPCVLINEVRFVGKSMYRIINFNNFQWAQKYLIICTHSRNNWLHRNKLVTKLVFFMLTCDSFKV